MVRRAALGIAGLVWLAPPVAVAQGSLHDQIAAMDQAYQAAYNAKDAVKLAAMYDVDAKLMAPGTETVTGRAAIQAFYTEAFKTEFQNVLMTGEVIDGGNIVVGTGGWSSTGPDGRHLDHGTYVTIYKKVKGKWMIYIDTWTSSMPMPASGS